MNKKQLRFIWAVIQPSLFSSTITVLICGAILLTAMLSYGTRSGMIYDFLFGPNSSSALIQTSKLSLDNITTKVFGNPLLNKAIFYMFWMFVGLVVYTILSSIIGGVNTVTADVEQSLNVNDTQGENRKTMKFRLTIRLLILTGWALYSVFYIKILLPYGVLASRIGVGDFPAIKGLLYISAGLAVLFISLHLNVILLRLFLLKLRVFSGEEVEELADVN